jgi:hypothetical protein
VNQSAKNMRDKHNELLWLLPMAQLKSCLLVVSLFLLKKGKLVDFVNDLIVYVSEKSQWQNKYSKQEPDMQNITM